MMTAIALLTAEVESGQREIERLTAEAAALRMFQLTQINRINDLTIERDTLQIQLDSMQVHETKLEDMERERDTLKTSAETWHKRYQDRCTTANDWRAMKGAEIEALEFERDTLRTFAQHIMQSWPCGDVDGGDLQDKAVELGLLKLTEPAPREPCGEGCECAQNCSADEFESGEVQCYRKTALLTGEKG